MTCARLVTCRGRLVTDGGRPVTCGGRLVTDGGRLVTCGGWLVTDGGQLVTDRGRLVIGQPDRLATGAGPSRGNHLLRPPRLPALSLACPLVLAGVREVEASTLSSKAGASLVPTAGATDDLRLNRRPHRRERLAAVRTPLPSWASTRTLSHGPLSGHTPRRRHQAAFAPAAQPKEMQPRRRSGPRWIIPEPIRSRRRRGSRLDRR